MMDDFSLILLMVNLHNKLSEYGFFHFNYEFKHHQWPGRSHQHKTLSSTKKTRQSWIHEHKLSLKVTSFVFSL